MNFYEIQVWPYENDREASGIILFVGPSLQEMPGVIRRAYMPRMSMLARVIRWRSWASLNFFAELDILKKITTILKNSKSLTIQETRP